MKSRIITLRSFADTNLLQRTIQPPLSFLFSLSLTLTLLSGCETAPTEVEKYHPEPVVSAFLCTGEPIKELYLERVAPLNSEYSPEDFGIADASVIIWGGDDTLKMVDDPAFRGRYIPEAGDSLIPQPLQTYNLGIFTPEGERVTARTLMPGPVEQHGSVQIGILDEFGNLKAINNGDTLTRLDANLVWKWADIDSAGGFQGILRCLTPRDSLIPLDPNWEPSDTLEDADRQRSDWMIMREDQRTVTIAWIFFNWVGPYEVTLHAVSRDYYQYLFSLFRVQQGFGGELKSNIVGGRGIFAGYSKRTMQIYMQKAPII